MGDAAVAGVSAAGNVMFIILALTQVLGVGTVALISHAVGRKDQQDANLVFNQSLLIAALCGVFALVAGYTLTEPYLRSVAADEATVAQGRDYLYWFLPGMALQFAMVAMSSALRGTGIVKPAHDRAGADGAAEHRARAGADRGLGYRLRDGRGRRGSGELHRHRSAAWCCCGSISAGWKNTCRSIPSNGSRASRSGSACSPSACRRAASSR